MNSRRGSILDAFFSSVLSSDRRLINAFDQRLQPGIGGGLVGRNRIERALQIVAISRTSAQNLKCHRLAHRDFTRGALAQFSISASVRSILSRKSATSFASAPADPPPGRRHDVRLGNHGSVPG